MRATRSVTKIALSRGRVRVFLSYSHRDERLRQELEKHLAPLRRGGLIADWHDGKILAGTECDREINRHLDDADLILLLCSPDFIASDYCYTKEMRRALERHHEGSAVVVPIIVRPSDWHATPFGKLLALPKDGKPVTSWSSRDEAFFNTAQGIRRIVQTLTR